MKKIKLNFTKEKHKLTILPTIQFYNVTNIIVLVWLKYEIHFYLRY